MIKSFLDKDTVRLFQRQFLRLAKQYRDLDTAIQATNWSTDLAE